MHYKLNGVAPLPHLGVIRVEGDDAAKFLHGQLTQDFSLLGLSEARLAGFCSAKGRMQASFIGFKRSQTEVLLVCQQDVLSSTLKRLSMFVMRAKAKLTDATADYALFGLAGEALDAITGEASAAWAKQDVGAASLISLYPSDGVRRALWLAPVAEPAPAGANLSTSDWCWSEVRSGIAMVSAAIAEAFVPQMLNYESVAGVNFKKGCYPGQEVVARSQFRGTLKRRAYVVHIDGDDSQPFVSQEVFHESDAEQPCGMVAQVAVNPNEGFSAIVSMQTSAADGGKLTLGSASGAKITLLPLPYPLLEDI